MMRIVPAAKAFAFAASRPASRNVAFTSLRMMSAAVPDVKVSRSDHNSDWMFLALTFSVASSHFVIFIEIARQP